MAASSPVRWSRPAEAVALVYRGATLRTALPIAALVGTVLSAVNQGSIIAAGDATLATWIRTGINYVVPFLVASAGWLSARRSSVVVSEPPVPSEPPDAD